MHNDEIHPAEYCWIEEPYPPYQIEMGDSAAGVSDPETARSTTELSMSVASVFQLAVGSVTPTSNPLAFQPSAI